MDLRNIETNEPFLPRTSYCIHDALRELARVFGRQPYTDRALRYACTEGRIKGAHKVGKTWYVPASWLNAEKQKLSEVTETTS